MIQTVLVIVALILGLAQHTSAQTLLGTCDGTVGVVTQATGLGNVYCTPVTPPPLLPTVSIVANPVSITSGQSSTLMWSSTNVTSCMASGNWNGVEPTSGSLVVSPAASESYTLTCTGAGGQAMATASVSVMTQVGSNCGMQLGGPVIFCDTFDTVNPGIASRTGALDPSVWGVSRQTGYMNFSQGTLNGWAPGTLDGCAGPIGPVVPPNDIVICNGQLREVNNDNPTGVYEAGYVTVLAMYPKQPFDFTGRTGTVSFDVSNDSQGGHGAWPEFWLTDLPVPAPFTHFDSTAGTVPANAFGVRFAAAVPAGLGAQLGPNCPSDNNPRWTIDSAVAVRNYVIDDTFNFGQTPYPRSSMAVVNTGCVIAPTSVNGGLNHVELRISQNQVDVYATDAGTTTPLVHIATIINTDLSLTRGLIWLEDAHYNADKSLRLPLQHNHTFAWDNVAFDGPFTYRDFSYDALDSLVPNPPTSTIDLGKLAFPNQSVRWDVLNMPVNPQATAVRVLFNFWHETPPVTLQVTVNGHQHSAPWPYPDQTGFAWRTHAVTIPITDLVPGTNVVQLGSDQAIVTYNVNIVLVNVPGGVPVLPGNSTTYPGGQTSGTCQFMSGTAAAFCESVASSSPGGRAGDLDDSKWSVSRTVGSGSQTNQSVFPPTPVSACKAGVTTVNPDNDIIVCDSASGHHGQFMTAMNAQNYGMLSMRPRQVFDFTGRTGVITFNVDAITQGEGSWWPAVFVTDEPISAAINSASVQGLLPTNGVGLIFNDNCNVQDASMTAVDGVFVYVNTVETFVAFSNPICFTTLRGQLNHIEIKLSTTGVEVWASDYSTDNITFPNFRMVGSATISIPFSRGYVHFEQKERAPIKNELGFYNPLYANNYWNNLGFDGPVVAPIEIAYAVGDSLTVDPNSATDSDAHIAGAVNVGYAILNNPNSMYSCCDGGGNQIPVASLTFNGVNTLGITSAKLTFNVFYTYLVNFSPANVALQYSINGGPWLDPNPQPDYAAQNLCLTCPGTPSGGEGVPYSFPINPATLVSGTNTVRFATPTSSNAFPPAVANVDLLTFH